MVRMYLCEPPENVKNWIKNHEPTPPTPPPAPTPVWGEGVWHVKIAWNNSESCMWTGEKYEFIRTPESRYGTLEISKNKLNVDSNIAQYDFEHNTSTQVTLTLDDSGNPEYHDAEAICTWSES